MTLLAALAELSRERFIVDRLLQHCGEDECSECSQIICPHGDMLHFHHDGCPSCGEEVQHSKPALLAAAGVAVPTNADEAAMMVLLGMDWLERYAPERLKRTTPPKPIEKEG